MDIRVPPAEVTHTAIPFKPTQDKALLRWSPVTTARDRAILEFSRQRALGPSAVPPISRSRTSYPQMIPLKLAVAPPQGSRESRTSRASGLVSKTLATHPPPNIPAPSTRTQKTTAEGIVPIARTRLSFVSQEVEVVRRRRYGQALVTAGILKGHQAHRSRVIRMLFSKARVVIGATALEVSHPQGDKTGRLV
jgi:hypothetical protein